MSAGIYKRRHDYIDQTAPLPLGYTEARAKAIELRQANPIVFTWKTIAEIMRRYHGFDRGENWWRQELRGDVTAMPRGGSSFTRNAA